MTGAELKALRTRKGLSQAKMADLLNAALGKRYRSNTISRWETETNPMPASVDSFLTELSIEEMFPSEPRPLEGEHEPPEAAAADLGGAGTGDTMPPPPPDAKETQQLPVYVGSSPYSRVCEELWEVIATGIGAVGAVSGNVALIEDGRIIHDDRQALGAAWGKLAETNATFRKMLTGMTEGGAWLQIGVVTGNTVAKMVNNHRAVSDRLRAEQFAREEAANGDGSGVVQFPSEQIL